jgi:hypothetical protein
MGISTWRQDVAMSVRDRPIFFAAKLLTSIAFQNVAEKWNEHRSAWTIDIFAEAARHEPTLR